jgi:hypothetical protein
MKSLTLKSSLPLKTRLSKMATKQLINSIAKGGMNDADAKVAATLLADRIDKPAKQTLTLRRAM